MPTYRRSIELGLGADDMFALVADIESYPSFIRWVKGMRVLSARGDDRRRVRRAEAAVGFRGFSERFVTDVTADAGARTIVVALVSGPFTRLDNRWRFEATPMGCRIDFMIDVEFRSLILRALLRANADYAIGRLMSAFIVEAHRRHPPAAALSASSG
jgi:coenzyme Q-binding protein COQ10